MIKKWIVREVDAEQVAKLSDELNITETTAKILINREITDTEAAKNFLSPENAPFFNPFLMRGMSAAVERISRAIERGEKICVYGDYDVDGMTASAILIRTLKKFGASVTSYIPQRSEGY